MVEAELGRFGDKRLACVGEALLASMQRKRTLCVHRLAEDRNQALQFGRFLANPAVTVHEMLAATGRQTNQRAAGRHVLAIMDTTELHFATHEASKQVGVEMARISACSFIRSSRWTRRPAA